MELMAENLVLAARCVSGSQHLQPESRQLQLEFLPAIVSICLLLPIFLTLLILCESLSAM